MSLTRSNTVGTSGDARVVGDRLQAFSSAKSQVSSDGRTAASTAAPKRLTAGARAAVAEAAGSRSNHDDTGRTRTAVPGVSSSMG